METALKLSELTDKPIAELSDTELKLVKADSTRRFSLDELLSIEFEPLPFYVDRLITSGLTLLWGAAKSGKSLLILNCMLAISCAGKAIGCLDVTLSEVLYISLEDGPRRLQKRLIALGAEPNQNFNLCFDWKRGDEGIEDLNKYLNNHPFCRVVVIDTLSLFARIKDTNDYSETTRIMETLKRVADEKDVCIIAIHHSKKTVNGFTGNILETALGSTGIVSGPDHLICLVRTPDAPTDAVLHFVSKDAEPCEIALRFDPDILSWVYAGEAADFADTNKRQEILDLLREKGPLKTGQIAEELDKHKNAVSNLLKKMLRNGVVCNPEYGLYSIPPDSPGVHSER